MQVVQDRINSNLFNNKKSYRTTPGVGCDVGIGVSKMLEFFHDCFYAIGEAQTDALSCMGQVLFGAETIFICAKGVTTGCKAVAVISRQEIFSRGFI